MVICIEIIRQDFWGQNLTDICLVGKSFTVQQPAHLESCSFLVKLLKVRHGIQSFLVTSRNKANSSQDFQHYKEQIIIKYGQYKNGVINSFQLVHLLLTLPFYIFSPFSFCVIYFSSCAFLIQFFKGLRQEGESSTFIKFLMKECSNYTFFFTLQTIQKHITCLPWILVLAFSALML